MFELIKTNLDKILLVTGAVVILFWPQVKAALAAAKAGGSTPSEGSGECPLCHPVSTNPTDKGRPEWTVVVMDLEGFCKGQRLSKAVRLCHELCNELVAGEPDKPSAASVVAKAAVKGGRK